MPNVLLNAGSQTVSYYLIYSLTKREISGRYRGSALGFLWSFLSPLLMLAVYTFCFGSIFRIKWPSGNDSILEFALQLFSGLMIFTLFAETINRAPYIITGNVNYVKKVVFPLEVLPIVVLCTSLFHLIVSLAAWAMFSIVFYQLPPLTIFLLPLVILPLILWILGLAWLLSALGVYFRDIGQFIGILTSALLFLTPIFYPLSSLPISLQAYLLWNPLTYIVEESRAVMIYGSSIVFSNWIKSFTLGLTVCIVGYFSFAKMRKGFADVL